MVGGIGRIGYGAGVAPLPAAVMRDLPAHQRFRGGELLPPEMARTGVGEEVRPRRLAIRWGKSTWRAKRRLRRFGACIKEALVRCAIGEPGDVLGTVGCDGQGRPV